MYCLIKYTEYNEKYKEELNSRRSMEQASKSYCSVKASPSKISLHENNTLMVNPDCYIQILVDYIASVINFDKNSNFDLCNEMGQLLNVKSLKSWESATKVLESQKTYFIVLYEKNDEGQFIYLEPILNQYSKEYFDLMGKLKKLGASVRKFSNESRRTRRRSADELTSKARLTSRASLSQENQILNRMKSSSKSASPQGKSASLKKMVKNIS